MVINRRVAKAEQARQWARALRREDQVDGQLAVGTQEMKTAAGHDLEVAAIRGQAQINFEGGVAGIV